MITTTFITQLLRSLRFGALLMATLLSTVTFANSNNTNLHNAGLNKEVLEKFCTENPIWSAFAIEPDTCLVAATFCARKPEFATIDPAVLSEPYYQCVFKQLEIETG